jgi:hypothetical protein
MGKLKPSEFEKSGVHPFGFFGIRRAGERLRLIYRTEQDPDGEVDLDAPADKWKHGGIETIDDIRFE